MTTSITPREEQVLRGLFSGETNKEVAHRLGISGYTVSFHLAKMRRKFDARTTIHLLKKVLELRVLTL